MSIQGPVKTDGDYLTDRRNDQYVRDSDGAYSYNGNSYRPYYSPGGDAGWGIFFNLTFPLLVLIVPLFYYHINYVAPLERGAKLPYEIKINPISAQPPGNYAGERLLITIDSVEFAFRWCPPGTFMMGASKDEYYQEWNEVQHQVTLTKGFWMMETEVTQKQWEAVMGYNPSNFKGENLPVENVSWKNCQDFCKMKGVQLPTEAQWEYACRAGEEGPFIEEPLDFAWYRKNSDNTTHPVATKTPNAWGLYDMRGNVLEWCQDWYCDYSIPNVVDPVGSEGDRERVCRGGSWNLWDMHCRPASRNHDLPGKRNDDLGFRCVIVP